MTASGVTLSGGGRTVDFNSTVANNIAVTHRFSNPVIKLPTPIATTDKVGKNVIIINIGFVNNSFDLSFQLHDGPGAFNFGTISVPGGTTAYETIIWLANYVGVKTLTLNGEPFTGHVENVNIPWKSGMKDLTTNGSLSFNTSKDITMGS